VQADYDDIDDRSPVEKMAAFRPFAWGLIAFWHWSSRSC
jgi:hypothetical protein